MNIYFFFSKIFAPFFSLINLIFFLLIINLFLYFFFKKKILKKIILFFFLIFFLISFLPIGNYLLKNLEKKYYNQEEYKNIDAIVVLAGSEDVFNTTKFKKLHLNNSSERLISFVELAQINKKAKLIFVGGNPYLSHKNILSEEDVAKIFFKNINFDHKKITFLSNSRNTIENFKELKFFLKESSYDNILLITSASHMKRSLYIANKMNLTLMPYAVDFKSGGFPFLSNYWQNFSLVNNLKALDIFFREFIGLLAVKIILR